MMENQEVIERIKASFCNLTKFKIRSNSVEVITAFSTLNNKFVSVFVTFTKGKIVVTDSGWLSQNYYGIEINEETEQIVKKITDAYKFNFDIKSTFDNTSLEYFYKTCANLDQIPSAVFDLANFIVGVVNSNCIKYKDEKEERERETFRKDANGFLNSNYGDDVKIRGTLNDFSSVKFNAIVSRKSKLYLIMYVTGSTQSYFENDLRKSICNFEIALKSKFKGNVKERLAILNDESNGYLPEKSATFFELLSDKSSRPPIMWSKKEMILDIV